MNVDEPRESQVGSLFDQLPRHKDGRECPASLLVWYKLACRVHDKSLIDSDYVLLDHVEHCARCGHVYHWARVAAEPASLTDSLPDWEPLAGAIPTPEEQQANLSAWADEFTSFVKNVVPTNDVDYEDDTVEGELAFASGSSAFDSFSTDSSWKGPGMPAAPAQGATVQVQILDLVRPSAEHSAGPSVILARVIRSLCITPERLFHLQLDFRDSDRHVDGFQGLVLIEKKVVASGQVEGGQLLVYAPVPTGTVPAAAPANLESVAWSVYLIRTSDESQRLKEHIEGPCREHCEEPCKELGEENRLAWAYRQGVWGGAIFAPAQDAHAASITKSVAIMECTVTRALSRGHAN